jgi:hypothetical protein
MISTCMVDYRYGVRSPLLPNVLYHDLPGVNAGIVLIVPREMLARMTA